MKNLENKIKSWTESKIKNFKPNRWESKEINDRQLLKEIDSSLTSFVIKNQEHSLEDVLNSKFHYDYSNSIERIKELKESL